MPMPARMHATVCDSTMSRPGILAPPEFVVSGNQYVAALFSDGATYVLSNASVANDGSYTCLAVDASGATESSAATLNVIGTSNPGHLVNISCRTQAGTHAQLTREELVTQERIVARQRVPLVSR